MKGLIQIALIILFLSSCKLFDSNDDDDKQDNDYSQVSVINIPTNFPRGLAFDGNYLWYSDDSLNSIYKISSNGDLIDTIKVDIILESESDIGGAKSSSSSSLNIYSALTDQGILGSGGATMIFGQAGTQDILSITPAGNFGIGTWTPNSKLEVKGMIHSTTGGFKFPDGSVQTTAGGGSGGDNWGTQVVVSDATLTGNGTSSSPLHVVSNGGTADGDAWGVNGEDQTGAISRTGAVGIGTTNPDSLLTVNGGIHAKSVLVDLNVSADFVFKDDYELPTLEQVEQHIDDYGHLPDIPSEAEVLENGINLGEMQSKLLQKIEELTLYVIELNKENERLEDLINNQ